MKVSKWVYFLKYAERIGTILLAVLLIVKGIKLIRNSIFKLRGKTVTISNDLLNEINDKLKNLELL